MVFGLDFFAGRGLLVFIEEGQYWMPKESTGVVMLGSGACLLNSGVGWNSLMNM